MFEERDMIPEEMLSFVTGGKLEKGWKNELNGYMQEYKSKGFSCGRFMEIIEGTPDIFGAANDKERKTVMDYIDSHWDSI